MSFIAFKISDYEHTAEREQYRVICNLLRSKYEASDELCVFVANYNIFDCEFDGILIKSDAIISIEFKNYGGKLSAFENGHWTLADGAIIKGGSRKSVYQQAKLNHIAIKRGLKEGGILPNRMLKDIPYLIVFAQPIILQNNLSEKVKSWLHICDSDHFIDKIEDVTTTNFNLSNEQILELITKLGLIDEFIDSRFSVDVNILSKKDIVQANSESLTSAPLLDILDTETELIKNEYYQFIDTQVLPAIGLSTDYKLMVVYYKYFEKIMDFPLPFVSEYVTILQVKNASSYIHTLKNLFNKDVISLSSDVISWGEGDFEPKYSPNVRQNSQPMAHTVQKWGELTKQCNIEEIILPSWIDEYIFNELNAQYKPSYTRFSYNLDLNKDECKIYLGTYFPRSFAEGYMSFNAVLHDDSIRSTLESKSVIKILDFGCGTGGEILGFLHAFENRVKANKLIKVIGIDGNQNSLRLLEKIIGRYNSRGQNHVELSVAPCFIESQADLSIISNFIGRDFDFIVTSKAIGEFERKKCIDENGYEFFAGLFAPLLGETGIMSIIDVTTKDEHSGLFLPQRMNIGINAFLSTHRGMFKSIAPCQGFSLAGPCMHPCFYKKDTYISHTAKSKDHSKFTVRFISRAGLGFDEAHIKKFLIILNVFSNKKILKFNIMPESDFYIDYASLDDFQRLLIDKKNNRSMVVTGSAGSGKSLIALHKAKQLATTGDSYVIIVYTKTLRRYFEDGMKSLGLRNVYHYHQWKFNKRKVKYMIVDECQDFTRQQIDEIREYGEICFFFGDTAQSIMGFNEPTMPVEETAHLLGVAADPLYFNYRLTKAIAKLGEPVGQVEDLELKCKRDGEKPNLIYARNFDEQLDKIAEIIKNRSLTNVGILLPTNDKGPMSVEYVKNYLKGKGVTCEFKFNANQETEMDLDFHSTNPKIMTWWCAKGLQFKDVFIPGCETAFSADKRAALYVAMTRCSERLYLGYSGSLCEFFPNPSSSIYNTSDDDDVI